MFITKRLETAGTELRLLVQTVLGSTMFVEMSHNGSFPEVFRLVVYHHGLRSRERS
jgi:hypothetical protein